MSSSTSSSDAPSAWRRFFRLAAGTALACVAVIYAFVVVVDPFDTLPLSVPAKRWPVATDARFAFPALARSARFDSAIFGTSTSRLLRPAVLNRLFKARFANLSMNSATAYEQAELMDVFRRAHPAPRAVMVGLDVVWCVTGDSYQKLTDNPFPPWMYQDDPWVGYLHMFNLYSVQEAGQLFGILIGIKPPVYGRDGYTRFVPPDADYDAARAAAHLREREGEPEVPPGARGGPPANWRYPALAALQAELARFPDRTRKILFFVPYNHVLFPAAASEGAQVWNECKRRVAAIAANTPDTTVVDFMLPSSITMTDTNYWDALHYRTAIADRLAHDLGAASRGIASEDDRLLFASAGKS